MRIIQTGFPIIGIGTQSDESVIVYKPSFAKQLEDWVKMDAFHHRLYGSISYYQIKIDDALRSDPDGPLRHDGKQEIKGFEIDLRAVPFRGLSISAGYGYNENKYIRFVSSEAKLLQLTRKTWQTCGLLIKLVVVDSVFILV